MGTPGAWTTNDPTDDFYYSLNTLGPHYWFVTSHLKCIFYGLGCLSAASQHNAI